jgi:HEAT repeat protein
MVPALALLLLNATGDGATDWAEFAKLAADKNPDRRAQAVASISPLGTLRMAQALLPLLADPHLRVRHRTVAALRNLTDPAALDWLAKAGSRHPHPLVRLGLCEILAASRHPLANPTLLQKLSDPDPAVQGAAAEALGHRSASALVDPLLETLRRDGDWPIRAYGLEAIGRLDAGRLKEVLQEASRDRHHQVRMVAAEFAPRSGEALDILPRLIQDRDWRVRASAIHACLDLRERPCVGWLVDRLAQEKGRLRADAFAALQDLTGKDLALEPAHWKAWWEANRETLQVRPKGGRRGAPAVEAPSTRAEFFKVPILSKAIVFLIDLSGSMRDPAPGDGITKLDVAKRGLLETVRALEPDTRFGILGLGCDKDGNYALREQKTWRRRLALLPASPEGKADAERFVRGLEAKGWTNLYDAIEHAFTDPDVDTVYLYSDGGASKGILVAAGEILAQLGRMNRFRRIVIHTVEVPGDRNPEDNRRLLAAIAEATGGTSRLHEKK